MRFFVFLLLLVSCSACTHVAPWQRGKLAHRTMNEDAVGPAAEHVYAVQEGAVGGSASVGGGCGCN